MQALSGASLAHLRHELRTPVNHILGFAEILIEDAEERHLGAFLPAFQHIRSGGHQLLEIIQSALAGAAPSVEEADIEALAGTLRAESARVLEACTALREDVEEGRRQTAADLDVISGAVRSLMEFGAVETLELARQASAPVLPAIPSCTRDVQARPGGKILVADDDPRNRDLLRRCLECEGHQVVEAGNGREVLALLQDQSCDLVLLDVMMPEMDGFETLERMKRQPQWGELPVIMISALDELQSVVRCIQMGADDYLPKPFNPVLLRARLGASLDKKWLRDRERRKTQELEQTLRLLEQAQAQLAVQASQDALTGLANRRSVKARLESLSECETPWSVIYLDLNGFKKINDTYGHQAGDDLLKQVGERLRLAFRSTDVVGRWGGDEFVALLDASYAAAQAQVSRITEQLSKEFVITTRGTSQQVSIGAAIGVVTRRPGETVSQVLQRADAEMYREKLGTAS
jgi:adenylate cyclase